MRKRGGGYNGNGLDTFYCFESRDYQYIGCGESRVFYIWLGVVPLGGRQSMGAIMMCNFVVISKK